MAADYDQQVQGNRSMSVLSNRFCVPHPTHLIAKKKVQGLVALFSDTILKVMDANNNLIFEVTSDSSTLRSQMVLFDAAGSPIATMRKKMFSWHTRWSLHKGYSKEESDKVYSLKVSSAFHFRTKVDVYLATNTSEETISDYRVKAGHSDLSATVYKGDHIVAEIANPFTWGGLVGKDELRITVNPGVDYAFIVTLVAILIEMRNSSNSNHQTMHAQHMHTHAQHVHTHHMMAHHI